MRAVERVLIGAVLVCSSAAVAEPDVQLAPNAISLELVGTPQRYTVAAERLVLAEASIRVGFSYTPLDFCDNGCPWLQRDPMTTPGARLWQFPVTVSYLGIRRGPHILELGAGATVTYLSHAGAASGAGAYLGGTVGYRFHSVGVIVRSIAPGSPA